MKLGAEPKKVAVLVGLLATAAYFYFSQEPIDDAPPASKRPVVTAAPVEQPKQVVAKGPSIARPNNNKRTSQEYKPVLKSKKAEDRIDPATVDPTLRLEMIARLANVAIQGGNRPVFEFGSAPPPKAPDPGKIKPEPAKAKPFIGPMPKPPDAPKAAAVKTETPKPKAPPIPLKYYGFTSPRAGAKRAFFMEGEEVYLGVEGETVKKKYKIVRINLNSVVMEDTDFKDQQTLPLVEQMQ